MTNRSVSTVERARSNAAVSEVDEAQTLPLPEPAPLDGEFLDPTLRDCPLATKISLVEQLARRTVSIDPRVTAIDAVEYRDEIRQVAIASTRGVDVTHQTGFVEMWSDALGEDGDARSNDYAYDLRRTPTELDPEEIATRAAHRTASQLRPRRATPVGRPVILDPHVVADVLVAIGKALSGGPISSGRTPFADRWGDKVASEVVTLVDDGLASRSTAGSRFDDEGVPRRRTPLITNGDLAGAMHSSVTARAADADGGSTGNAKRSSHKSSPRAAPTSLMLTPTEPVASLLDGLDDAIYVHRLTGAGVGINPVTGRIDVGAAASWWRDGQIVGRLDVLPFVTDLISLLKAIVAVGDDVQPLAFSVGTGATVVCTAPLLGS